MGWILQAGLVCVLDPAWGQHRGSICLCDPACHCNPTPWIWTCPGPAHWIQLWSNPTCQTAGLCYLAHGVPHESRNLAAEEPQQLMMPIFRTEESLLGLKTWLCRPDSACRLEVKHYCVRTNPNACPQTDFFLPNTFTSIYGWVFLLVPKDYPSSGGL